MAKSNSKLVRFFSEQGYRNRGYLDQEDDESEFQATAVQDFRSIVGNDRLPKTDLFRQTSQHVPELKNASLSDTRSVLNDQTNKPTIASLDQQHMAIDMGMIPSADKKQNSQRLRWNLVFNLLVWTIVPLPIWIPYMSNKLAFILLPSIQGVFVIMWLVIAILALKNAVILFLNRSHDFTKECHDKEQNFIRHIVAISCYKEPLELITKSIQTLADQTEVHRITMVISFEQRTPEKEKKCEFLQEKFHNSGFERIIFTIHPFGQPNEIPGKCSNANYGLRAAVNAMGLTDEDMDNILVTTCDADSKFPPQYIAALTSKYLKDNRPALSTIYQSPLFYNWKLDGLSFVTRVTGLLRSFLMLGALIPFNINTMSIFSFSLRLAKQGNFIHPGYQMDDIICLIRWMGVTQNRLKISMIPVPVLSGPTSGETIEIEIMEWARQARRWTIGAAEVFHYFIIKSTKMPCMAAFSWGLSFIIYYGILLCTGGLFGLTTLFSMVFIIKDVPIAISYILYGLFGLQMFAFSIAFLIDAFIPRILQVKECIWFPRNFFHFLTTPLVLLSYSLVELYALHEVVVFGKKVCKHGASAKGAL